MNRCKTLAEKIRQLDTWYEYDGGGVLILGYDMFRILLTKYTADNNDTDDDTEGQIIKKCLKNPGPDLVICDEGHTLKSDKTSLSNVLSEIRTMRRIALTGTPLQNNLDEYYCMVQFIKPYLLGTMKEFRNRFSNPIKNGEYIDSTPDDIHTMRCRSYILHTLLDGCIQRASMSVLEKFLKPKSEFVVYIRLTNVQVVLYRV